MHQCICEDVPLSNDSRPQGPWALGKRELRGLIHISWQSCSKPSNTEVCEELAGAAVGHQCWKRPPSSHHHLVYMHTYVYMPIFIKMSKQTGVSSSITPVRKVATATVSFHKSCQKV